MTYYLLATLVILLQIGDMMTTIYILNHGGSELNPVMVWIFSKVGVTAGLTLKAILVSVLAIIALLISPAALIGMAAIYLAVFGWNCYQVFYVMNAPIQAKTLELINRIKELKDKYESK